jgi:hypothetical protein
MPHDPRTTAIYHITDVANLPAILAAGGLFSDEAIGALPHQVIGYAHIKVRRMTEYRVPCCGNKFVGEFVPFYFCPRSPMLFTVNKGSVPGRPAGCQKDIVHLVSDVQSGIDIGRKWAISDGNAGAAYTSFHGSLDGLDQLDWNAIRARDWRGLTHQKMAEFLVEHSVPWTSITQIACYDQRVFQMVSSLVANSAHRPSVAVKPEWYY